jgi:hypothetical protein
MVMLICECTRISIVTGVVQPDAAEAGGLGDAGE